MAENAENALLNLYEEGPGALRDPRLRDVRDSTAAWPTLPPFRPRPSAELRRYSTPSDSTGPSDVPARELGDNLAQGNYGQALINAIEMILGGAPIAGARRGRGGQRGSPGGAGEALGAGVEAGRAAPDVFGGTPQNRPSAAPQGGAPGPFRGFDPTALERSRGIAQIHRPTAEAERRYVEAGASPLTLYEYKEGGSGGAAEVFMRALADSKAAHPSGASVTQYGPEDYAKMRTFLTPDRSAGFAINNGDDIVSVFRHPDAPYKKAAAPMLDLATQTGGARLDAFDTMLPHIYSRSGFKGVARVPFDSEFAPPDWNYDYYRPWNEGKPDVVFMAHDPSHGLLYRPGDGVTTTYDLAAQLQREAVEAAKTRKP